MALAASVVKMARLQHVGSRHMCGLPYRIRAPLAKLQEKKKTSAEPAKAQQPMLGDGEQLEAGTTGPDYMRLALTSRVYDMVSESPMQPASSLSQRFGADIHLKREDLLPSFSFKLRGDGDREALAANRPRHHARRGRLAVRQRIVRAAQLE